MSSFRSVPLVRRTCLNTAERREEVGEQEKTGRR